MTKVRSLFGGKMKDEEKENAARPGATDGEQAGKPEGGETPAEGDKDTGDKGKGSIVMKGDDIEKAIGKEQPQDTGKKEHEKAEAADGDFDDDFGDWDEDDEDDEDDNGEESDDPWA